MVLPKFMNESSPMSYVYMRRISEQSIENIYTYIRSADYRHNRDIVLDSIFSGTHKQGWFESRMTLSRQDASNDFDLHIGGIPAAIRDDFMWDALGALLSRSRGVTFQQVIDLLNVFDSLRMPLTTDPSQVGVALNVWQNDHSVQELFMRTLKELPDIDLMEVLVLFRKTAGGCATAYASKHVQDFWRTALDTTPNKVAYMEYALLNTRFLPAREEALFCGLTNLLVKIPKLFDGLVNKIFFAADKEGVLLRSAALFPKEAGKQINMLEVYRLPFFANLLSGVALLPTQELTMDGVSALAGLARVVYEQQPTMILSEGNAQDTFISLVNEIFQCAWGKTGFNVLSAALRARPELFAIPELWEHIQQTLNTKGNKNAFQEELQLLITTIRDMGQAKLPQGVSFHDVAQSYFKIVCFLRQRLVDKMEFASWYKKLFFTAGTGRNKKQYTHCILEQHGQYTKYYDHIFSRLQMIGPDEITASGGDRSMSALSVAYHLRGNFGVMAAAELDQGE